MVTDDIHQRTAAFKQFLLSVILEDSKTREAFGRRLGVNRSRITQLTDVNSDRQINYQTIVSICKTLRSKSAARQLYDRYIHDFVRGPHEEYVEPNSVDDVGTFIAQGRPLVAIGYQQYVQSEATKLFKELRSTAGREDQTIGCGMLVADGFYTRGLQPRGINVLNSLGTLVETHASPQQRYDYLLLKAVGYRPLGGKFRSRAIEVFTEASDALDSLPESNSKREARQGFIRDRALLEWHEVFWDGDDSKLNKSIKELSALAKDLEGEEEILAYEVLARGLTALGDFEQAQEFLQSLAQSDLTPLANAKRLLTETRYCLGVRKVDEAHDLIVRVVTICEEKRFGHYQREAYLLQSQLVSGDY